MSKISTWTDKEHHIKLSLPPWRAVYFKNHDMWDVDSPREEHLSYSILESPSKEDVLLIAAAPKLLDLIKEIASEKLNYEDAVSKARELIKEIENGEPIEL